MAIKKQVVTTFVCVCDKCKATQKVTMGATTSDGEVPDGWGAFAIKHIPRPAVFDMVDNLEGKNITSWGDDIQLLDVERVLCPDCMLNVWSAIGLPELPKYGGEPKNAEFKVLSNLWSKGATAGPPYPPQDPANIYETIKHLRSKTDISETTKRIRDDRSSLQPSE
jgi:hypothetical protein